jgi:hypothetical protein
VAQKLFTKTESLKTKKSPKKPSSRADAEIFRAHRLLVAHKPLTKTESLRTKKSPKKPSSTADTEIFDGHKLLLAHKPLTKTRSLGPKNHPRSPRLCLTLPSSTEIDYCWLRNSWRKLHPSCPKPSSTPDAEIFGAHRLLQTQKSLMKNVSLPT